MNRDFVDQSTVVECCNADGLYQSYQFVVNVCVYVCIYVCMCVYTCTYVCMYIYM